VVLSSHIWIPFLISPRLDTEDILVKFISKHTCFAAYIVSISSLMTNQSDAVPTALKNLINGILFVLSYWAMRLPFRLLRHSILRLLGMKLHQSSVIYMACEVRGAHRIEIGENTTIGHEAFLDGRGGLKIGDNVNLSSQVMIWTAEHDVQSSEFAPVKAAVIVEDFVWLSCRCIILPGVTVGKGAVVAAGAVVTKSVEPYSIVAGVPAKIIGHRNHELDYHLGRDSAIWFA
jgi:acetyltransferase-like isoleucine patch superfamily enzyme